MPPSSTPTHSPGDAAPAEAEVVEHPPQPRGHPAADVVVADDARAVADPGRGHPRAERRRGGERDGGPARRGRSGRRGPRRGRGRSRPGCGPRRTPRVPRPACRGTSAGRRRPAGRRTRASARARSTEMQRRSIGIHRGEATAPASARAAPSRHAEPAIGARVSRPCQPHRSTHSRRRRRASPSPSLTARRDRLRRRGRRRSSRASEYLSVSGHRRRRSDGRSSPARSIRLDFSATDLGASAGCNHDGRDLPDRWRPARRRRRWPRPRWAATRPAWPRTSGSSSSSAPARPSASSANDLILEGGSSSSASSIARSPSRTSTLVGPTWTVESIIAGDAVSSVPAGADRDARVQGRRHARGQRRLQPGRRGPGRPSAAGSRSRASCSRRWPATGPGGQLESAVLGVLGAGTIAAPIDSTR